MNCQRNFSNSKLYGIIFLVIILISISSCDRSESTSMVDESSESRASSGNSSSSSQINEKYLIVNSDTLFDGGQINFSTYNAKIYLESDTSFMMIFSGYYFGSTCSHGNDDTVHVNRTNYEFCKTTTTCDAYDRYCFTFHFEEGSIVATCKKTAYYADETQTWQSYVAGCSISL